VKKKVKEEKARQKNDSKGLSFLMTLGSKDSFTVANCAAKNACN